MEKELTRWLGMSGVPAHDSPRAYYWERQLHWVMVAVALLAVPAFYLDVIYAGGPLENLGWELELVIFVAFTLETAWMVRLSHQKWRYLKGNWLNLLIIAASLLGLVGYNSAWLPLARLLRIAYVALILARIAASVRSLLTANAVPYAVVVGLASLAIAGAGFYYLEPTIKSYGDGLWLAFVTGSTVGYGDMVPTTAASRVFAVIMVVVGLTVFSLITASISTFFVGEDEKVLRRDLHRDIRELREEIARLRAELCAHERREDLVLEQLSGQEKHFQE